MALLWLMWLFMNIFGIIFGNLAPVQEKPHPANTGTQRCSNRLVFDFENIETVSRMPYLAYPVAAARQEDCKPFISGVMTLMFDRKADGTWKLMSSPDASQWQNLLDKEPLGACPVAKNFLEKDIAFKPQLEFFLSRLSKLQGKVVVEADSQKQEGELENGCVKFSKVGEPAHFPTLQGVKSITLSGIEAQPISLPLAPEIKPFLLVRYRHGEILPVPARLDTIIYDHDLQRLHLTYRATALTEPRIRKMEFQMVGPETWVKASESESYDAALARNRALHDYLEHCPLPQPYSAGEACANPKSIDYLRLRPALGIKPSQ